MFSHRYQRPVQIARHARQRMAQRGMDDALLLHIIETGTAKYRDSSRLWLYQAVPGRDDNLLCTAAVLENVPVVKTVTHHFEPQE